MDGIPEKKAIVVVEDNQPIAELIKDTLNGEPDYQAKPFDLDELPAYVASACRRE